MILDIFKVFLLLLSPFVILGPGCYLFSLATYNFVHRLAGLPNGLPASGFTSRAIFASLFGVILMLITCPSSLSSTFHKVLDVIAFFYDVRLRSAVCRIECSL